MNKISIRPIGTVISPVEEMVDENWGEVISKIALNPEYHGGLEGLEKFSHVMVVTFMHKAKFDPGKHLKRHPRGLDSLPPVGIFSQRSKDRPNPLGITAVKLLRVGEDYVEVQGLDAVNGTPVLDIKPYVPQFDRVENCTTPDWMKELMKGYF